MSDKDTEERLDEILENEPSSLSSDLENAETMVFESSVEIKPNRIVYGDICDCGYVPTGEHQNARIAAWKCRLKAIAHRIRHPFKERTDFQTHLDEMKTTSGYLDGPELFPDIISWEVNHKPREKDK